MLILKEYQEKAVKQLIELTCDSLQEPARRIQMLLKAPTGSGKTVTMAAYLSRLVQEVSLRPNLPCDIAFIWLAPNTLHLQSYQTLKWFYSELHELNAVQIEDLENNAELRPKDLLFVNWSSVDKEKNTFRKENEQNFNLETLIEKTHSLGTEIIVLIDEAHLSAFTGEQAKKVLQLINAKIEISITATPLNKPDLNVIISRQKVVAEEMIKKGVKLNEDISPQEQLGENLDFHLLKKAIQKRNRIAQEYKDLGVNINPLLLIQLPSEKATLTEEDKSKRDQMEKNLEGFFSITTNNGKLAIWLSDKKDKINLDGLEKPNAIPEVLIFKQAISQGWDCPRAAVLIIFREIGNPTFGVQTVGRILRMPEQKHYNNDFLDFGHAYTNIQSNKIIFEADDLDYFSMQIAKRKENLTFCKLLSSNIVNDRPSPGYLLSNFERIFYQLIEEKYGIKKLPDLSLFPEQNINFEEAKKYNRNVLTSYFWNLNVDEIEINIPTNISVDNYEVNSVIVVDNAHIGHFSKTQTELDILLERFCYDSITRLNKSKSWKILKRTLIQFAEYYLDFDEYKARKILLYSPNKALLVELITTALENYDIWQRERGNVNKRVVNEPWEVPVERSYTEIFQKLENIKHHALEPFYELKAVSSPEKAFADFLDSKSEFIDWWYKNGDKGKEHFAVSYTNSSGELSLFYVDFVAHFKSGKIGLFDTKTKRSDPDAPSKHNALIEYMALENTKNPSGIMFGGITIPEATGDVFSFRFCREKITDTHDLTGWSFINPAEY